ATEPAGERLYVAWPRGRTAGLVRGGPGLSRAHHGESDEADRDPDGLAQPLDEAERDRGGGRQAQGRERRQEAALQHSEARRHQESRDLDRGAEGLDHRGRRQRYLAPEEFEDQPRLDRAHEPGDEMEPDRKAEPARRRPIKLSERVIDAPERRLTARR